MSGSNDTNLSRSNFSDFPISPLLIFVVIYVSSEIHLVLNPRIIHSTVVKIRFLFFLLSVQKFTYVCELVYVAKKKIVAKRLL